MIVISTKASGKHRRSGGSSGLRRCSPVGWVAMKGICPCFLVVAPQTPFP